MPFLKANDRLKEALTPYSLQTVNPPLKAGEVILDSVRGWFKVHNGSFSRPWDNVPENLTGDFNIYYIQEFVRIKPLLDLGFYPARYLNQKGSGTAENFYQSTHGRDSDTEVLVLYRDRSIQRRVIGSLSGEANFSMYKVLE